MNLIDQINKLIKVRVLGIAKHKGYVLDSK